MLTAALTILGRSEKWFWNTTPRKFYAMMEQKKKMNIADKKLFIHLFNGGKIDDGGRQGIPGLDYPSGEGATSWLKK